MTAEPKHDMFSIQQWHFTKRNVKPGRIFIRPVVHHAEQASANMFENELFVREIFVLVDAVAGSARIIDHVACLTNLARANSRNFATLIAQQLLVVALKRLPAAQEAKILAGFRQHIGAQLKYQATGSNAFNCNVQVHVWVDELDLTAGQAHADALARHTRLQGTAKAARTVHGVSSAGVAPIRSIFLSVHITSTEKQIQSKFPVNCGCL